MSGMSQQSRWSVLGLRGWVDSGRLRVRLLRTDATGDTDRAAASDPAQAARIVEGWLSELADGHDDPQTHRRRSRRRGRRRWLPRFGR
jgi:hypothetical protein